MMNSVSVAVGTEVHHEKLSNAETDSIQIIILYSHHIYHTCYRVQKLSKLRVRILIQNILRQFLHTRVLLFPSDIFRDDKSIESFLSILYLGVPRESEHPLECAIGVSLLIDMSVVLIGCICRIEYWSHLSINAVFNHL